MANRRQAIIWTNADPVHWRIYTALEVDDLTALFFCLRVLVSQTNSAVTAGEEMVVICCSSVIMDYYCGRCGLGNVRYVSHFTVVVDAWIRFQLIKSNRASLCWLPEPHGLKVPGQVWLGESCVWTCLFRGTVMGSVFWHPSVIIQIIVSLFCI